MVSVLLVRAAGTNCDAELTRAFELAGAGVESVHLERLVHDPARIARHGVIAFPGGFSYGDDVASGRVFAMRARERLYPALSAAVSSGCPILGVCNGFQVLVQVGLLPGPGPGQAWPADPPQQVLGLTQNSGAMFVDRWVGVRAEVGSPCIWTRGLPLRADATDEQVMTLPVANGEGRLVAAAEPVLDDLERTGRVALRYTDNYNGSDRSIAGVCDASGLVLGLMPHPERYLDWNRHPAWTRLGTRRGPTPGLQIFQDAVEFVRQSSRRTGGSAQSPEKWGTTAGPRPNIVPRRSPASTHGGPS